jgi:molybdenum-dependent DNA-binding transcriptional regulator ModE
MKAFEPPGNRAFDPPACAARTGHCDRPGKADLLEHIRDTGSIAAAGRRMHMSYRRA